MNLQEDQFPDICRFCLQRNRVEIPIFQDQETENPTFLDKITACLPVKISEEDDLPKKVCCECSQSVDFIFNFRQLCTDSENQLQTMLKNIEKVSLEFEFTQDEITDSSINDSNLLIRDPNTSDELADNTIEIREVFFSEQDYVSDIVKPEQPELDNDSLTLNINDIISKVNEPTIGQSPIEEGAISQIIESTSLSLQTSEENSTILKLWNVAASEFFFIPYQLEALKHSAELQKEPEALLPVTINLESPKTRIYSCSVCESTFNELRPFLSHYKQVHQLFKCPFCVKHFARSYLLKSHLLVHSNRRDFVCSMCKMEFKRRSSLRQHVKRVHTILAYDSEIFLCDTCGYQAKDKSSIRSHVLKHVGNSQYVCDICDKQCRNKVDLNDHRNSHFGIKSYRCDICDITFTRKGTMLMHRKTQHEGLYSYCCDICGRSFLYKTSLSEHMKLHNDENRVDCDICGKTMSGKTALLNHKKMHSEQRDFVCGICGKMYINKYSLQEHLLVHTGSKPFQCLQCDNSFSSRKKLLMHERVHDPFRAQHKCPFCEKSYLNKFKLKDHIRKHHAVVQGNLA